jgi:hypothetical protein
MTPGLLPQPGGFEGFLAVEKLDPPDGFVLLDPENVPVSEGNLDATSLPPPLHEHANNELVPRVEELGGPDAVVLPRLEPPLVVSANGFPSVEGRLVCGSVLTCSLTKASTPSSPCCSHAPKACFASSMFSSDIAYSDSPAASRASAWVR